MPVLAALALGLSLQGGPPARTLDDFESVAAWSAHPADGVSLTLHGDTGRRGRALRMDFAFSGGGYAIARRALDLPLSGNYAFSFWIRGEAAPNTLEFKLADSSGANVWWYTERDRDFPRTWQRVVIRKRQIAFAWGPAGGGELHRAASLEIVITAGKGGGRGSVWIDDLAFTPLPEYGPYTATPSLSASSATSGHMPPMAMDGDTLTAWRPASAAAPSLTVDFQQPREFGGLTLLWEEGRAPVSYAVRASDDGVGWRPLALRVRGNGRRDHLLLKDAAARYVRLTFSPGARVGLRELRVEPLEFAASRNAFLAAVARDAPPGTWPRAFLGRRALWTVVGVDGAAEEALLSEDGALEAGQGLFSVEPFVRAGDRLLTWRDGERDLWLELGSLPIPSVRRHVGALSLTVSAFATGPDSASSALARYRVSNDADTALTVTLVLAVRPLQVNPPPQFLGVSGGWARVDSVRWDGALLHVGDRAALPLTRPAVAGATPFAAGEIGERLWYGEFPRALAVRDTFGAASAALAFPMTVAAHGSQTVSIVVPLSRRPAVPLPADEAAADAAFARAVSDWNARLAAVTIRIPGDSARIAGSVRAALGQLLVNRDGGALQPGSRAYARAWIRDGALMSEALLRFGLPDVARRFIEWYAPFQYASGKVPCCVDARGADPVDEHDSHGELIWLVAEYFRHTGDTALVTRMWPHVRAAAAYLDSLRRTTRTPQFAADSAPLYGLLPPSISHEGYSAKPAYSYWDDFFALRGLQDAAMLAVVVGRSADAAALAASRDEFRHDLAASIAASMAAHRVDVIPGAADLGDFDATSTTIAVAPGGDEAWLPRAALERTFARYWQETEARRGGSAAWEAYTPYELRAVGTFIRLGWRQRALTLLDGFLRDQEPPGWRQWPEVVWRDTVGAHFIGDLPHTWVGAEFLRSVADLFAYEREADSALVVGAGIPDAWLGGTGLEVTGLHTWWGTLALTASGAAQPHSRTGAQGDTALITIGEGLRVPPGGIVVMAPGSRRPRAVSVDGAAATPDSTGAVIVRRVPAAVRFEF